MKPERQGSGNPGIYSASSEVTPDKTLPSGGVFAAREPEVV